MEIMWVKICGICDRTTADQVADLRPDAIGQSCPGRKQFLDFGHVAMELRGKTVDRFQLSFKVRADVDSK